LQPFPTAYSFQRFGKIRGLVRSVSIFVSIPTSKDDRNYCPWRSVPEVIDYPCNHQKKGLQASPFKGNHPKILPNPELPSFQGEANPKSKIQNPKSSDEIE
jgi:hypothetical protein